ncbi:MAG: ABC transporter permease [Duodenibacillus sp.]
MWTVFLTLFQKEVRRFAKVWVHTLAAPMLTGGLYLFVFGEALSKHLPVYEGVTYTAFIIPGLIMMTLLQNAFSNTASSLLQSKISGTLVFLLLPSVPGPIIVLAHVAASFVRAASAGVGLYLLCAFWAAPTVTHPLFLLAFGFCGCLIMASLGIITALWAQKYDQMGAVMNFVVVPLTFLSGVFYSVDSLPGFWRQASHLNPFFYLVDGFRQGFFGQGSTDPWFNLAVVAGTAAAVFGLTVVLVTKRWRLVD